LDLPLDLLPSITLTYQCGTCGACVKDKNRHKLWLSHGGYSCEHQEALHKLPSSLVIAINGC
jgi:hypothetical protein